MTPLYRRLTRSSHTINQINRVHIALENRLTPIKAQTLMEAERDESNLVFSEWIDKFYDMFSKGGAKKAEPFLRQNIASHVDLFSSEPLVKEKRGTKTLVLCFTGAAQRMMMPLAVFLQHFDATRYDVVMIRYPKREGYRHGIPSFGEDIEDSLLRLMEIVESGCYAKTVAFGVSGGAAPALLCGLCKGVSAVLAVGINHPDDERWREESGISLRERIVKRVQNTISLPPIHLLYGRESAPDKEAAYAVSELVSVRITEVSHTAYPVGHVALFPILMEGKMSHLLETVFLDS
jgi:hypothetical protein